jgi:peptide deformylase
MYKILTYDDKILHQSSDEIKEINAEIIELSEEMFKSMYYSQNGIGLAAVQIGVPKRMFVLDIPEIGKYTIINPKIIDKSVETQKFEEGCLSLPGIASEVERSRDIVLEYLDLDGNIQKLEVSDFLATVIQHEYDHLDGILFVDRLPPDIRLEKLKEYKELHIV